MRRGVSRGSFGGCKYGTTISNVSRGEGDSGEATSMPKRTMFLISGREARRVLTSGVIMEKRVLSNDPRNRPSKGHSSTAGSMAPRAGTSRLSHQ